MEHCGSFDFVGAGLDNSAVGFTAVEIELGFGSEAEAEVEDVVGRGIDFWVGGEGRFAGELFEGIQPDRLQSF